MMTPLQGDGIGRAGSGVKNNPCAVHVWPCSPAGFALMPFAPKNIWPPLKRLETKFGGADRRLVRPGPADHDTDSSGSGRMLRMMH